MTLFQFNQLSGREQEIALKQAVFLVSRQQGDYEINLYQLCNFYVEVYGYRGPLLQHYRAFYGGADLAPYLGQIKLPE